MTHTSTLTELLALDKTVTKPKKMFTFISRQAPYGKDRAQLCLDAALAATVFEQKVNYVFSDDGVYQLLKHQNGDMIGSKTLGNALEALDLYGIEEIFVNEASLRQRNLHPEDLLIKTTPVTNIQLADLILKSDYVINL